MRPLLVFALLAATAHAQRPVVDGRSIAGRWDAVEVLGDWEATLDLQSGALTTALVVAPGGAVQLLGTDWKRRPGQTVILEGRVVAGRVRGARLRLAGRRGEATLERLGPRLHLVDPTGRETVFERRAAR